MAHDHPISEQDLRDGLAAAAETLAHRRVSYAVIGGMAAGYRSQPRFTKDIDFLLRVPQVELPALLESLQKKGFEFDELTTIREWTQEHMTTLSYHGIRVDWLKPVIPVYQHILERATDENWLNHTIRVASAEGLILLKLLAFRTQDLLDIENLVAAQRERLDLAWIRAEWQTLAPLDDPRMVRLMNLARGEKSS
ncbi:MAG: nucleotidyltransferase [Gemmataceae bacterium]|nr:nucleotidyltransferase [Gemmataceae bacterium]